MTLQRLDGNLPDQVLELTEQNTQLSDSFAFLQESLVDLEMDDLGWTRFSAYVEAEFTSTGRQRIVENCRMMAIANPMLKRGLALRTGYIWGQGVEVLARVPSADGTADPEAQKAVNQVVDDFEKLNDGTFTGMGARDRLERAQGTDGEVFLALFTDPYGEVRVRLVPQQQIIHIVHNPEDADEPWFYVRQYTVADMPSKDQSGSLQSPPTHMESCIYPALGFDPKQAGLGFRPTKMNNIPVMWDAPMVHIAVNQLDGWQRGIPDVYASMAFARLYTEFLIDWSGLTKALSKIAWKATGETKSRAQLAAAAAKAQQPTDLTLPRPNQAGQTLVTGPGSGFEAVSKSGATIDADSGRPVASMVAAGLGVPVTALLADPGITGARAVAQTLTDPMILEMGMRRLLWQGWMERIYRHQLEAAQAGPGSPLRGVDLNLVVLEFIWPPLAKLDPAALVQAIVQADATGKLPPLTTVRLLLSALGVPNADEVVAEVTDASGKWEDPNPVPPPTGTPPGKGNEGPAAAAAARAGKDPAAKEALVEAFDPKEPRDPHSGKWIDSPVSDSIGKILDKWVRLRGSGTLTDAERRDLGIEVILRGEKAPTLYRGADVPAKTKFVPGQAIDFGPVSTSSALDAALPYAENQDNPTIFVFKDAKALNVQDRAEHVSGYAEEEWVTAGRFYVVSVRTDADGNRVITVSKRLGSDDTSQRNSNKKPIQLAAVPEMADLFESLN